MSTIVTRSGKGSPLTNTEVDANFTNLNTDKLEISGGTMTGDLSFGDNDKAIFGAGSDLQIYHNGDDSYISDNGSGDLTLKTNGTKILMETAGGDTLAEFINNGNVVLYSNNVERLRTKGTGIDVTGDLSLNDGTPAILLKVSGAEKGYIRSNSDVTEINGASGSALRQNGFMKLETNTTGISVTGNATFADNGKAIFGADSDLQIYHNGNNAFLDNDTGTLFIQTDALSVKNSAGTESVMLGTANGAVNLYHDNEPKLATTSTGISVTGNATFADNGKAIFGTGSDLQIYHDGSSNHTFITETGSGHLYVRADNLKLQSAGGDNYAQGIEGAGFFLYHDDIEKLKTTSTGIDVTGTATSDALDLTAIAKDISDTAVDVFVYDTSKDSDGGAWRKRTQGTSWYNETLNTATRGSRKEFPAVAVIVAESNQVTIYDGDDPDLPMWMVFNQGNQYQIYTNDNNLSSIQMLNGKLCWAGFRIGRIDFIKDASDALELSYYVKFTNPISGRNTANYSYEASAFSIVNNSTNDVAMTVQPNAPIDAATGLPVPTIAVATVGGVSVIKDDGTVVDIVSTAAQHEMPSQVKLFGDKLFWLGQNNYDDGWSSAFTAKIPSADVSLNYHTGAGSLTKYTSFKWATDSFRSTNGNDILIPIAMDSPRTSVFLEAGKNDELILGGKGSDDHGTVVKVVENLSDPESGMITQIASDFATGYQVGDIKLATLSDTDDTNVTGSELVTNGTFASSDVSYWNGELDSTATYDSGRLKVTKTAHSGPYGIVRTDVTTVVGKQYLFQADSITGSGPSAFFRFNDGALGAYTETEGTTHRAYFTATSTSTRVALGVASTSANAYIFWDNVSVQEVEEDRSVNGNGLQVFGTVTKANVATNTDLKYYSGWSTSNYLFQPYNSDLNFTSAMSIMFWVKNWSNGTSLLHRGPSTTRNSATSFMLYNDSGYDYRFVLSNNGSNEYNTEIQLDNNLSGWQFVCFKFQRPTVTAFLNGELKTTNSGVDFDIFSQATNQNGLYIGLGPIGSSDSNAELALFRISATAPSPEQIKKIYEDEKVLFQENAKATLYGTSDAVTALAHDDTTDLLHVGTSAGRSVFQGLRRVDNTTDAVGAAISASNGLVAED